MKDKTLDGVVTGAGPGKNSGTLTYPVTAIIDLDLDFQLLH